MPEHYIISDLCIGANAAVRTVVLASETPIADISTVYIDSHSRTSAALSKILAKHYWKIEPVWVQFSGDITCYPRNGSSAAVIIGDKAFSVQTPYICDLAVEWRTFSGLPFVFACWVANKPIDKDFINRFNNAMKNITDNINAIVEYYREKTPNGVDLYEYWSKNISYPLTADKLEGMNLFLKYAMDIADR